MTCARAPSVVSEVRSMTGVIVRNGDPLIMDLAVASCISPLVPSPAIRKHLSTEFSSRPNRSHETGWLAATKWSAKLSGTNKHPKQM